MMLVLFDHEEKAGILQNNFEELIATIEKSTNVIWPPDEMATCQAQVSQVWPLCNPSDCHSTGLLKGNVSLVWHRKQQTKDDERVNASDKNTIPVPSKGNCVAFDQHTQERENSTKVKREKTLHQATSVGGMQSAAKSGDTARSKLPLKRGKQAASVTRGETLRGVIKTWHMQKTVTVVHLSLFFKVTGPGATVNSIVAAMRSDQNASLKPKGSVSNQSSLISACSGFRS